MRPFDSLRVLIAWCTYLALPLGVVIIWTRDSDLVPLFLSVALVALVTAVPWAVRATRDLLNPVSVVVALGLVRWSIPALIMAWTDYDTSPYPVLVVLHLTRESLMFGHVLALTGMLAFVAGWMIIRERRATRIRWALPEATPLVSWVGMLVGLACLTLFVGSNAPSVAETAATGAFRGIEVQEGTGWFFKLALILIPSATLATGYLLWRGKSVLISFAPGVFATSAFFILGGRARALVPLVTVSMLIWYRQQGKRGWPIPPLRTLVIRGMSVLFILAWIGYIGYSYRGGGGTDQVLRYALSRTEMVRYLQDTAIVDIGHLHGPAGAGSLQAGALGGGAFASQLTWPLSEFIEISGPLGGRYIVGTLSGGDRNYGVHPSIMGDAYLHFGFMGGGLGVAMIPLIFGVALKLLYGRLRASLIAPTLYALIFVYAVQMFLSAVHKWSEGVIVMVFGVVMLWVSHLMTNPRRSAPGRIDPRVPSVEREVRV